MSTKTTSRALVAAVHLVAMVLAACGGNTEGAPATEDEPSGGDSQSGRAGSAGEASPPKGGSAAGGKVGTGAAGSATGGSGGGRSGSSGAAGEAAAGMGGAGGTSGETSGGSSGSGGGGLGPYAPRSGSFKAIVYSRQGPNGFRHAQSIETGKVMMEQIAHEQGFTIVHLETDEDNAKYMTPEALAEFELMFFLNPSSRIFDDAQRRAFEDWMTQRNGAFVGVHAATDTENGNPFWSEVTGQFYDGHGVAGTADEIVIDPSALGSPAFAGLPNPWPRVDEWFLFRQSALWGAKPGFKILARKASDGLPVVWSREYGNFRSFYTALGHSREVFEDAGVKKHITGALLWTVRREHGLK